MDTSSLSESSKTQAARKDKRQKSVRVNLPGYDESENSQPHAKRTSFESTTADTCNERSELWEQSGAGPDYKSCDKAMESSQITESCKISPRTLSARSTGKKRTINEQAEVAREIPLLYRAFGILLGFFTVVFIWETTDTVMALLFKSLSVRLVAYLSLVVAAAASLVVTHNWVLSAESSLVPSFFYSLNTLFLAIGSWGVAKVSVAIMVEPKQRLFCYATIATITLICTVLYALDTRHNVLLDIASCATTLGLTSDELEWQHQCCDEEQGC